MAVKIALTCRIFASQRVTLDKLDYIKAPIADQLERFEEYFKTAMKSDNVLLNKITHYIIRRKGKQMRPLFVFLSSQACGGIHDSTYTAASLIELLHTATLVHDDVVDVANVRRGFFSINALWKNKIAVLVGDFLLSRGLLMSVERGEFELLKIVSRAVQEMSEGELLQQEKSRLLDITEEVYYNIIQQKTASLIAACCHSGASSSGASPELQESMYQFGLNVGMAFQIKDDLLDYGFGEKIGKPIGIDIKERKLTLPLIYVLQRASRPERNWFLQTIKRNNTDGPRVKELVKRVIEAGGIDYAVQRMEFYRNAALQSLHAIPETPSKLALIDLVHYTIDRKK